MLKGAGVVLVIVLALVLVLTAKPKQVADVGAVATANTVGTALDRLGERGTPTGEGLTPLELEAPAGVASTGDGLAQVPTGTVDGPGRRIFGGITVEMPSGGPRLTLRQIGPEDLGLSDVRGSFLRWDGWVAVLTAKQKVAISLPSNLDWRKADADDGVTVNPGSTVRLRTMFRLPSGAGKCTGRTLQSGAATSPSRSAAIRNGQRAQQTLQGAPGWLVRRAGTKDPWAWLRVTTNDEPALPKVVRTGPVRSVLFRGSSVCADLQTSISTSPDPAVRVDTPSGSREASLPVDSPGVN